MVTVFGIHFTILHWFSSTYIYLSRVGLQMLHVSPCNAGDIAYATP